MLAGSGRSVQSEGGPTEAYEVGPGDCLVHRALEHAHTLHAGPEGLDVLVFGERHYAANTLLPNAGVSWLGPTWVLAGAEEDHPWAREAAVGPAAWRSSRLARSESSTSTTWTPSSAAAATWVAALARSRSRRRLRADRDQARHRCPRPPLGAAALPFGRGGDLRRAGGKRCARALRSARGSLGYATEPETHPVGVGSTVARPAGTRVAHAFRAGPDGLTLLAYGTRDPNDIAYLPPLEQGVPAWRRCARPRRAARLLGRRILTWTART